MTAAFIYLKILQPSERPRLCSDIPGAIVDRETRRLCLLLEDDISE